MSGTRAQLRKPQRPALGHINHRRDGCSIFSWELSNYFLIVPVCLPVSCLKGPKRRKAKKKWDYFFLSLSLRLYFGPQAQVFIINDTRILLVQGECVSVGLTYKFIQCSVPIGLFIKPAEQGSSVVLLGLKCFNHPPTSLFQGFFSKPETFLFFLLLTLLPLYSIPTQCSPTQSPALLQTHTYTPHSVIRTQTNKSGRACPAPSPSSAVCVRAVSNCTLSLIGSGVQCTAVDADKSFFQSPAALSKDVGGEKKLIVPWLLFK